MVSSEEQNGATGAGVAGVGADRGAGGAPGDAIVSDGCEAAAPGRGEPMTIPPNELTTIRAKIARAETESRNTAR